MGSQFLSLDLDTFFSTPIQFRHLHFALIKVLGYRISSYVSTMYQGHDDVSMTSCLRLLMLLGHFLVPYIRDCLTEELFKCKFETDFLFVNFLANLGWI